MEVGRSLIICYPKMSAPKSAIKPLSMRLYSDFSNLSASVGGKFFSQFGILFSHG